MLSKIIKRILILATLILIFNINSNSQAATYSSFDQFVGGGNWYGSKAGETVPIKLSDYYDGIGNEFNNKKYSRYDSNRSASSGFYCVDPAAVFPGLTSNYKYSASKEPQIYTVAARIYIIGDRAYNVNGGGPSQAGYAGVQGKSYYTSIENLKMLEYITASNENNFFTSDKYSNFKNVPYGCEKDTGPVANVLWRKTSNWAKSVDKNLGGINLSGFSSAIHDSGGKYASTIYDKNGQPYLHSDEIGAMNSLITSVNNIATDFTTNKRGIIKNFNANNVRATSAGEYVTVGPYALNFNTTLDSLKVSSDGQEVTNPKICTSSNGSGEKTIGDVKKNTTFYIKVPKSQVPGFPNKVNISFRVTNHYTAREGLIICLKGPDGFQDVIPSNHGGTRKHTYENVYSYTYSKENNTVKEYGDLKIIKKEKVNGEDTGKTLNGAEFQIKRLSDGKWVKIGASNKIEYVDSASAGTFKTSGQGEVLIKGLEVGTYAVIETKPPTGYEILGSADLGNIEITKNTIKEIIVYNEKETPREENGDYGDIRIKKIDSDTGESIGGVVFYLKKVGEEPQGWLDKKFNTQTKKNEWIFRKTTLLPPKSFITLPLLGTASINNLPIGKYEIYEVLNPNKSYTEPGKISIEGNKLVASIELTKNSVVKVEVSNKKKNGDLIIRKVDEDNPLIRIKGAVFIVKPKDGDWIKNISMLDGGIKYTKDEKEAMKVETDSMGVARVNHLPHGTYVIKEIENKNEGYEQYPQNVTAEATLEDSGEHLVEFKIKNKRRKKDLTINKEDLSSGKRLNEVDFKLKHRELGWVVEGEKEAMYVDSEDAATVFTTKGNGTVTIHGLEFGKYDLYELENRNNGYERYPTNPNNPEKPLSFEINVNRENFNPLKPNEDINSQDETIKNEKVYVNLSGKVWKDVAAGKNTTGNNQYDSTENGVGNVKVTLHHKNNPEKTKEIYTDKVGDYWFEDVEIKELENYFVEFEYNGLDYKNVNVPDIIPDAEFNQHKYSKAKETTIDRENLNNNFTRVEGETRNKNISKGYTINSEKRRAIELEYNHYKPYKAELDNRDQIKLRIKSSTIEVNPNMIKERYEKENKPETIENIDLGLYELNQPDIALINDLDSVTVSLNGYSHKYTYGGRQNDKLDVEIRQKDYTNKNYIYTRNIYKSDWTKGKESLSIQALYRIKVVNQSSDKTAVVYGVDEYFDNKYSDISAYVLDEKNNKIQINMEDGKGIGDYKKVKLNKELRIKPSDSESIWVELKVNTKEILKEKTNKFEVKLKNVAEISSYSTYDENGKIYAGIDSDSNPGNIIATDISTYEDDTDMAPGFEIKFTDEEREIKGNVFLDNSMVIDGHREGNGKFDSGENNISQVTVNLVDSVGNADIITTNTNAKGEYTLSGFIPGDYTVKYTWNEQNITNKDGKNIGTINPREYKSTIVREGYANEGYANAEWYLNNTDRYSLAVDDWKIRNEIDDDIAKNVNGTTKNYIEKAMISYTGILKLGIEKEDGLSGTTDGNIKNGNIKKFTIPNIDFGIVERPKQSMKLDKELSKVVLTTENNTRYVDMKLDQNGHWVGTGASTPEGLFKIEFDNEILQGATLESEYIIKVENTSEKDYDDEKFYKYGTKLADTDYKNKIIKIKGIEIKDYLDADWNYEDVGWNYNKLDVKYPKKSSENSNVLEKEYLELTVGNMELEPGKSASTEPVKVVKKLANADSINFYNFAEISKIDKSKGSPLPITPGNLINKDKSNNIILTTDGKLQPGEPDEDEALEIIIVPSTGENRNFTFIIIATVGLLGIIAVGIILIKKKVIGNN